MIYQEKKTYKNFIKNDLPVNFRTYKVWLLNNKIVCAEGVVEGLG